MAADRAANGAEPSYEAGSWESADGLTLRYRDYPARPDAPAGRPPILCLPALTRNARDFEPVADSFAGEWRVICPDLRGRGASDYAKDPATYAPLQYVEDILLLLDQLGLTRVVAMGTSLGGIVTMLLAVQRPGLLAGAMLNDIGPVIEEAGLDRVRDYVGHGGSYPTWMHAAGALAEQSGDVHPDFAISDWLRHAKRLMCLGQSGRIVLDYDMKIAEPFDEQGNQAALNLWPALEALAGCPTLTLRGELSDILSAETLAEMGRRLPDMELVTVPRVGHIPTLEEPPVQEAMARLLARVQ